MDFKEWIDKVGGIAKAAEVLKMKERTVASWFDGSRTPSFTASLAIVKKTNGLVDYNGIYRSVIAARKVKKGERC